MRLGFLFQAAAFAAASQAAPLNSWPISCQDVMIPVKVSADNYVLPSNLTMADLTLTFLESTVPNSSTIRIEGEYSIGARYCTPSCAVPHRKQTLQVLVHGITYTRNYWSGLAEPGTKPGQDEYSWIVYAAGQGYATLSVDRLCNGASTHLNGIAGCQLPLEVEVVHAVIAMARTGQLPEASTRFNQIILAGHSYGSILVNALSVRHPDDADALLLTGFSFDALSGLSGAAAPALEPAALVNPVEYGNLDPSYLEATNETGTTEIFYYDLFDPAIACYDFAHRGTATLGGFATTLVGQQPAPAFHGPVFVLNGNDDVLFCEPASSQPILGQPGNCSAGPDQGVHNGYPAASAFGFFNAPDTGHCLNLHFTSQQSFAAAHRFLEQVGF
jgi:pimeloyl-ACP methyl ester carboxylesterase